MGDLLQMLADLFTALGSCGGRSKPGPAAAPAQVPTPAQEWQHLIWVVLLAGILIASLIGIAGLLVNAVINLW